MNTPVVIITLVAIALYSIVIIRKSRKKQIDKPYTKPGQSQNAVDLPANVKEAISKGQTLEAIKLYKAHANCSLAEARGVIEGYIASSK